MKKFICFCLFIIFVPCVAKTTVELGIKMTRFFLESSWRYSRTDSIPIAFDVDVAYERYYGASTELLISFIKNLYLRMELIELKKFDTESLGGGFGLNLFSNVDVDALYILPLWRRVSPLLYGGVNFENFYGKPYNDIRAWGATYEYRLGMGVNYRFRRNTNIFIEIQSMTWTQYTKRIPLVDVLLTDWFYLFGLGRVNLGCRVRI